MRTVSVSASSSRTVDGLEGESHRAPRLRNDLRRRDRKSPSTSAASIMPTHGMRWIPRELDEPPLRRIPVPGRWARLRAGVARIPRCHRHHQRVVVVDTLAVPVRGGGLAVDGEAEGVVLDDDGVR